MVGLLVLFKLYAAGDYHISSQYLKFGTMGEAQFAAEAIRSDFTRAGYTVTTKIIQGVA